MLADLNIPEPPLKSISEMGDDESIPAADSYNGTGTKSRASSKRKPKTISKPDDDVVKTKRAPRKRKTVDSANSDATGTSAAPGADETPTVSRRGSGTRKRGATRGRGTTRGGKRGRSASRASSTITSTTIANDHDHEDFDDDWGRSIDEAITKEMLEGSTSLNSTSTDKENNVPARQASRPRPRKKQKVSAEAEQ